MEHRTQRLTLNEKKFIETALLSDLRIDGRRPFDYRNLTIQFGNDDGSSAEVQLGPTRVMAFVTAQLVEPYRDRPNEGTLSFFTEFSPMADPSFEPGRPGESAVELGLVIDRGLRESRAVDTESLCVVSGKLVWAIRVDLHILDNGGNLIDAANIAALAALLTFRRPECSLGGENGREVIVHPPEEREPRHLIIHHLPIAVTFGFFSFESSVVIDPSHHEEVVMRGRMTAMLNANGDVCAIQKAGGQGVFQGVIMQCLRIAVAKADAMSDIIKQAVDSYNTERASRKIKRHSSSVLMDVEGDSYVGVKQNSSVDQMRVNELSRHFLENLKMVSEEKIAIQRDDVDSDIKLSEKKQSNSGDGDANKFIGGPSSWDPYSNGVDSDFLKSSLASKGMSMLIQKRKDPRGDQMSSKANLEEAPAVVAPISSPIKAAETAERTNRMITLKDAVKPKNSRSRRKSRSSTGPS